METVKEYRKRAAECRALAIMADPDHCGMIEFIAAMWDRLATERADRRAEPETLANDDMRT